MLQNAIFQVESGDGEESGGGTGASRPQLAYTVAFDPLGRAGTGVMAKMLVSSLTRTHFAGEIVVFRNTPTPLFLIQRQGVQEIYIETPPHQNSDKTKRAEKLRSIPSSWWRFHAQWVLLNREAAELLTADDLTPHWQRVFAPEEAYAGTMLEAKGYWLGDHVVPSTATWTRWAGAGQPHPVTYDHVSPAFAADLATSGCFFARKFAASSNIGGYGLHR